ncbi:hypothetical protein Syun_021996 [Stephania yunnanensis]|uniref:Putative plant transposon protein domain-containing protein n=1 Tax=Stephania yunnanensis TaxID=152371 RepID=A0AAP0IGN0_9MAGN
MNSLDFLFRKVLAMPVLLTSTPCLTYIWSAFALTMRKVHDGDFNTRLSSSTLTTKYYGLFMHSARNICPVTHDSTITWEDAIMLYAIGCRVPIDVGRALLYAICERSNGSKTYKRIFFPCFITTILVSQEMLCLSLPTSFYL